ncbi:DNA primase [Streptomyces sp. NPDC048751]|uniref:DNA primase n=1 Tax=Streptomyces sp. NPDC048751 TaxID=3365591 RepID=UPI00371FF781
MNRMGLGLAIGAGYVLGRTKKMKLAMAVGSLVAGKKLNLTPKGIADLVSQQLANNPQFKEIGDQLKQDLSGVGKAASGAMVERQMTALADRLHGRTGQVRDQLAGVVPGAQDSEDEEEPEEATAEDETEEDEEPQEEEATAEDEEEPEEDEEEPEPPREEAAKKAAKKAPAKKAPAKKSAAGKAPAKKAAAKKTTAKKTAGRKTAAARGGARRAGGRLPKGGGE